MAVHPTRTEYTFADKRVRITLTFLTPALPWDLDLLWAVQRTVRCNRLLGSMSCLLPE
jgi:hypothetical protein